MENSIKVYAPATVSNLACGFDVLGLAIEKPGDEMIVKLNQQKKIRIIKIIGNDNLPYKPSENVAGIALQAMLDLTLK